jgi:hypothetical protein
MDIPGSNCLINTNPDSKARADAIAWLKLKGWKRYLYQYGTPADWLEDPVLHCGSHWEFALKEQHRRDDEPGYLDKINRAYSHLCTNN